MTDTQLTIIIASITPTLAALGAMTVSIINAIKGSQQRAEQKKAIEQVHTIVNNHSTIQTNKIDDLQKQVEALVADRAEMKQVAALLAQKAHEEEPPIPDRTIQ